MSLMRTLNVLSIDFVLLYAVFRLVNLLNFLYMKYFV